MNFHLSIWKNSFIIIVLFISVGLSFLNIRFWWASIVSIGISFFYFLIKFPRLANHSNIEFFIASILLSLLTLKLFYKNLKLNPNLISAIFRVVVVTIYFYTGFHKLNADFFNPCVSCVNNINEYIFEHFTGIKITLPNRISTFFQYCTILVEIVIPFGLFWKQTRKLTAILVLTFHFYLNFAVYADFSSLGAFLVLGCVLNFESTQLNNNIIRAFKYYAFFTMLAIFTNYLIFKCNINTFHRGFIHGLVFNIGWFIFFYTYFKNNSPQSLRLNLKQYYVLAICVICVSAWSLKTYVGLGNIANFTMFSNLLTEKSRSNHLILDTKKTKIFDFEEDNVLILKLPDTLKNQKLENFRLPLTEFKYQANQLCKKYKIKLGCTLVYKNDTIVISDLHHSKFSESKWWYKYVFFRKIQPKGPNECYW